MSVNTATLDGIAVFVAVVKAGSFTAAAQVLGHSTSWVSKEVSRLESRLGLRLLNRTTRSISLTDAGRAYFDRCEQIVIDAENAEQSVGAMHETARGLLRINAPVTFSQRCLNHLLPRFMHRYPELELDIEFNDRRINVVEEGFDVVIRVGDTPDSSIVARKFSTTRIVTVASPGYLAENGRPQTAADLKHHQCIAYAYNPNPAMWEFRQGFEKIRVPFKPRLTCNSGDLETAMVLDGVGIGRVPWFCVEEYVNRGEIEVILDQYQQQELGVYAVYPHRQYLSTKVRALVDFLVESFSET